MKILENAKHSNYLIRKYGSYQIIPSGVLLQLKLALCCLDNVLQYFHTKLIVQTQTHSFHGKVIKKFSVKVGILGKSTQSKLLQALNWQITHPNKKNDFGTMQFFKKKCFFVFKQIIISIRSYQRSSRKNLWIDSVANDNFFF